MYWKMNVSFTFQPMTADDVTDSVIYALSAPIHVQVIANLPC